VLKVELLTTACLVMAGLALGPCAHAARAGARPLSAELVERSRSDADAERARRAARALTERWAPVFVQRTAADHAERDRPLRVDFDGDWDATNDWVHLDAAAARAPAVAYGSAILSETHAFLTFTLFYPRDWIPYLCVPYVCHDNDLEVVLLVIDRRRAESADGLVLVETKTHNRYLSTRGAEVARADMLRPLIAVESQGHGLESVRHGEIVDGERRMFAPAGANVRAAQTDGVVREDYTLLSLYDTLWARRQPSASGGRLWTAGETGWLYYSGARAGRRGAVIGASMAGHEYPGGVRPPWALKATEQRGDWFLDPAFATLERHARWFDEPTSVEYEHNPYLDDLTRECTLERCVAEPPVRASVALSPVALGLFVALGLAAQFRRRRREDRTV
jgi:hypothetical protein